MYDADSVGNSLSGLRHDAVLGALRKRRLGLRFGGQCRRHVGLLRHGHLRLLLVCGGNCWSAAAARLPAETDQGFVAGGLCGHVDRLGSARLFWLVHAGRLAHSRQLGLIDGQTFDDASVSESERRRRRNREIARC